MILKEAKLEKKRRTVLVQTEAAIYGCDNCQKVFNEPICNQIELKIFKKNCNTVDKYHFCCYKCFVNWIKTFNWDETIDFITLPYIADKKSLEEFKLSALPSLDKITRVEVIDEKGRSYVNWKEKNQIMLSFQDNNRTLKIFIHQ